MCIFTALNRHHSALHSGRITPRGGRPRLCNCLCWRVSCVCREQEDRREPQEVVTVPERDSLWWEGASDTDAPAEAAREKPPAHSHAVGFPSLQRTSHDFCSFPAEETKQVNNWERRHHCPRALPPTATTIRPSLWSLTFKNNLRPLINVDTHSTDAHTDSYRNK